MADIRFATEHSPDEVAAQVQEEQERAQREAVEEFLKPNTADPAPQAPASGVLPMPPGFVGYLARYILGQAMRPVPEVATVAALGIMAGLAGQQWNTFTNTGLNLYIVLVARSGVGKEAMHDGISEIRYAMAEQYPASGNYFDFTEYASGPALIKACAVNWCFLNISSELGHRFKAMANAKDGPMTTLRKTFNQLYMKSSHPAAVTVTHDDLEQMKRSSLGLTPIGVKRAAKARASARELFLECGSAEIALAALVSGLPKSMVDRFCRSHLGR